MPLPRVVWDDFCPLCLCRRACRARACEVEDDVDALQEHYAVTRRNGLVVFALGAGGGEVCADARLCQLTCLACGCAVIHGEEEDFVPFRRTVLGERGGASVATLHEILERRKAVVTTFWDTPVHEGCARQMPCEHFVPRDAPFCAECFGSTRDSEEVRWGKQQRAVRGAVPGLLRAKEARVRALPGCAWVFSELPRIPWKPGSRRAGVGESKDAEEEEASSGLGRRLENTKAARGKHVGMLKPPSLVHVAVLKPGLADVAVPKPLLVDNGVPGFAKEKALKAQASTEQQQVVFADEEACRSLVVASARSSLGLGGKRGAVLRKPKPPLRPKPPRAANQHSVSEMLGARAGAGGASGARHIAGGASGARHIAGGASGARHIAGKGSGKWCFWQHCSTFDDSLHGFRMIKGQLVYRFPDGRTVRAGEVSSITEDGELVPEEAGEGCIESGRKASSI